VIISTGAVLRVPIEDLRSNLAKRVETSASTPGRDMRSVLDETERQQILAALEQSKWVVAGPNGAAARLGMKRSTLQSRMQKLAITPPAGR